MVWKRQKPVISSRTRTQIQRSYNTDTWRKSMRRLIFRMFNKKGKPMEDQATYFSNLEKPIRLKDRGVSVLYINENFSYPVNSEHIQIVKGLDIDEVIEKYGLDQDESNVVRSMFRYYNEEVPLSGLGGHVESRDELGAQTLTAMIKGYRTRRTKNRLLSLFKYFYYNHDNGDIIKPSKSKSSGRIKDIFGWSLDDTKIPNRSFTSSASLTKTASHSLQHAKLTLSHAL